MLQENQDSAKAIIQLRITGMELEQDVKQSYLKTSQELIVKYTCIKKTECQTSTVNFQK